MTMPGGENIAISIKTSADTSGLQTARTEVGALATETKAATDAMAQASTEAAAVGATLANAAAKSVTDTSKMAASAEQVALAWERAGGVASENFERFRTELGAIVNAQAAAGSAATESASATLAGAEAAETSTTAVDALAVAEVKATSATKALAVAEQQSAVATLAGATASKQRGAALAEEAGKIEKIPGSAKTAANAVGLLSQAALTGQGSIAGMAAAAGNLASGLATVTKSAQLAAGAAGIGAIISLGAAAYGIYHSYSEESRHLAERLGDVQSETRGLNAAINGNELGQRLEQIRQAGDSEIRQIKEIHFHTQAKNDLIAAILEKEERSAALARDDNARSVARETADSAEARYRAQAKIIELDRQDQNRRGVQGADSAAAQRLVNVAQAGEDAIFAAHNQAGALIGQLEGQYESHRRTIQADYATELHSLDQMTLAEGQRAQLVDSYNAKRQYGLQLLDREQRMQRADMHGSPTPRRNTGTSPQRPPKVSPTRCADLRSSYRRGRMRSKRNPNSLRGWRRSDRTISGGLPNISLPQLVSLLPLRPAALKPHRARAVVVAVVVARAVTPDTPVGRPSRRSSKAGDRRSL
jgi:hypothetical protein